MAQPRITINLWFENQAQAAAKFYAGIFPNSTVNGVVYYPDAGQEITRLEAGNVMSVPFELDGQSFLALNGGKVEGISFNESISMVISCDTQKEIDHYWDNLTADGGQESQCGWLKDKYGLSWQVVPPILGLLLSDPDHDKSARVMTAMLRMKKLNIANLQAAANNVG